MDYQRVLIQQRCHILKLSRGITGTLKGHIQLKIKIHSILVFSNLLTVWSELTYQTEVSKYAFLLLYIFLRGKYRFIYVGNISSFLRTNRQPKVFLERCVHLSNTAKCWNRNTISWDRYFSWNTNTLSSVVTFIHLLELPRHVKLLVLFWRSSVDSNTSF